MTESISSLLKDWIPYKLFEEGGADVCRWLYLGEKKFTDPFFDNTISICRKLPENNRRIKCVSSAEVLPEWEAQIETVAPTAFIFHISRCGSTLVSQLLGLQPSNIVLSEVPFFDELLRWGHKHNKMQAVLPLLKAAISMYGAKRAETNHHLFIKTDSWHIHFFKELRELYPNIPFILLYRQPDEVIRSQQKRRGMQSVQGVLEPEIFGFDKNEIIQLGLDEYMARVIETYLAAFIAILQTDKLALPVNYNEGILTIVKKIATVTGITIHEKEMAAMEKRSNFHAKYPEQLFKEEQEPESIPEYLDRSFKLYNEVEKLRIASPVEK
jgi:hypothetical protein